MTSDMSLDLTQARHILTTQPFSDLIGARITEFEPGATTLEIPLRDELRQQNGHAHGGVLCYAADNALTFAAGSVLGPAVITSGLSISYLRPARGHTLRVHATVTHAGRRQAVCRCDLFVLGDDGETALCAIAQGTVLTARKE